MTAYDLSPDAEADLEGVWNYTCDNWGADQADKYMGQIATCCERIAAGEAYCRRFPEIDPRLGSHHCQHHYIFFLETASKPIIIAVLHERMEMLTRLKRRLG
jgi:toxin ParE1/3/4